MPIDYRKYAPNWKTEIRPAILKRANNCCEICGVPNYKAVLRGTYHGKEAWQTIEGKVFSYPEGKLLHDSHGIHGELVDCPEDRMAIAIVLTVAHLNHDITDNRSENLKALCQKCHNRHDAKYRARNRNKNKNQLSIF